MGGRGAEQGEDAVAEHLVDGATVADDVVDQALERGVDQPADPLGVHVLGPGGVPDQVREQDRDQPPFLAGPGQDLGAAERAEPCTFGKLPRARATRHRDRAYPRRSPAIVGSSPRQVG